MAAVKGVFIKPYPVDRLMALYLLCEHAYGSDPVLKICTCSVNLLTDLIQCQRSVLSSFYIALSEILLYALLLWFVDISFGILEEVYSFNPYLLCTQLHQSKTIKSGH